MGEHWITRRWGAIRIKTVQRVEAGESPVYVVRILGFSREVIYDWRAKYREGGREALKAKAIPGRPPRFDGKSVALDFTRRSQPRARCSTGLNLLCGHGPR